MNLGTIVSVKPGLKIPQPYLDKLTATHTTRLGFAAADDEAPGTVGFTTLDDKQDWHKSIENILGMYTKSTCVFHFGTYSKTTSDLEEQPYALLADGDKVLLSAMLEGDFPGYAGGEYNNEFNLVRDFLSEAIKELYQANGEDLAKMMEEAGKPGFRRTIKGVLAPRGAIMLIPGIGDPVLYSENIMGNESGRTGAIYDWGITTRHLGYTEAKPEPKVEAPPATMSKADRLKAAFSKPAGEPAKVEQKAPTTTGTVPVVPPKTDTKIPDGVLSVSCPPQFHKKEREQWVRQNVVKGHQFKGDWMKDRKYRKHEIKDTSPLYATFAQAAAEADKKQEVRQTPDQPLPKAPPGVEQGPLPVISPTAKQHVMGLINDQVLIVHPDQFTALEKPFDSLTEQLAINPDTPLFWSFEGYTKLCQHNVYTAACLLEEFRRRILADHPEVVNHMLEKLTKPEVGPEAKQMTKQERLAAAFSKQAA